MTKMTREKRAHALLKKAGGLVGRLTTLLDEARLELERSEKGEYVVVDGRSADRHKKGCKWAGRDDVPYLGYLWCQKNCK